MGINLPWQNGRLKVSENKRFLCHENEVPFFWLGDTGWLLFSRLTREEAEIYLEDRRKKGFNVIQIILLHELPEVNVYGKSAFAGEFESVDWASILGKPYDSNSYDFWDHVDYIISLAAQKGIYMALVPIWGSEVKKRNLEGRHVYEYSKWLAIRYKDKPNIIWINGGDSYGDAYEEVWQTIGNTIKENDLNHLMTFHPFGRTQSSKWFHKESWLDFNMFQSGHRRYDQQNFNEKDDTDGEWKGEDNWRYVQEDYEKEPPKPTIDGEPSYEGIPQGLHDPKEPYWTADDCRRYAYWAVFAGAFGHTYGNNAIIQMHKPKYSEGSYGVKKFWYEAIHDEGGCQMQYLKKLMTSVPFFERLPDQSIIEGENGQKYYRLIATRGDDYLFVYTYTGRNMSIKMGKIAGDTVDAWWYSPRDGSSRFIGSFHNLGVQEFDPPGKEQDGNDWVLVLKNSKKPFSI